MKITKVKTSVCMATYNGEKYIIEQLKSILHQLSEDDEVVISDDSSSDNTVNIIKELGDSRIKILENNTFRNPIFNFENALKHAKGDYIFLSDQDDVWKSNKLEISLKYLKNHEIVLSDCSLVNDNMDIIIPSYFDLINSKPGLFKNLFKINPYMGCCMVFKKEVLLSVLPFPKKIPMHDMWIGFLGELLYKPIFIKDKLIFHRRHAENTSLTGAKSTNSSFKKVNFRIMIIKEVLLRFLSLQFKAIISKKEA